METSSTMPPHHHAPADHADAPGLRALHSALLGALAEGADLRTVVRHACGVVASTLGVDRVGIGVYGESSRHCAFYQSPRGTEGELCLSLIPDEAWSGGPLARLREARQPIVLAPGDASFPKCPESDGPPSEAAVVPLRAGDRFVGVLCVCSARSKREITAEKLQALEHWAPIIAAVVQIARAGESSRKQLALARRLHELGVAIAQQTELDDILRMVRDALTQTGLLDRVGVYYYDEKTQTLRGTWGTTRSGDIEDLHATSLDPHSKPDTPVYKAIHEGVSYVLTHRYTETLGLSEGHQMHGVQDHCVIPMRAGEKVVGVITGDNLLTGRPITEEDIALVLPFAQEAAVAVINARLVAELRAMHSDLERQVRERTRDLEALYEETFAVLRTLSHDFRSPVRAMQGFASSLLDTHGPSLPPQARRDLERMAKAAERLGLLLEALLTVSKLSRRRLELQPVEPHEAATAALVEVRRSHLHACYVDIRPMPTVLADRGLLKMLYEVLLDNAFAATSETIAARIEVGCENGEYYVRDNGRGFDPAFAHAMFDLFRKGSPDQPGLGAGLAIARRIVSLHGGTIRAEGKPGAGATFYFTIGSPPEESVAAPPSVLSTREDR